MFEKSEAADVIETSHGEVVTDGQRRGESCALAIFRNECETGAHGVAWRANADVAARYRYNAVVDGVQAEQGAAEFGASGPDQSGESHNFAGAEREADVFEQWFTREMLDAEKLFARWKRGARVYGCELAAHHVADDVVDGKIGERTGVHCFSVAEQRDAVANHPQFFQAMGDVDDADIAGTQRGDDAEHFLRFGVRERRSGLVEDQEAGTLLNGAADFDHLLAGRAEFIHSPSGLQWEVMFFDDALGALHHRTPIHPSERKARLAPQKDIFCAGEAGGQHGVLMKHL